MLKSTKSLSLNRSLLAAACALACLGADAVAATATHATISIASRDAPGKGFNDPTPVAPVGGNMGTTLGEQRMIVYRYVADIWERNLQSPATITVNAGWQEDMTCDATSAVLGSAGAWNIWANFPNAPKANTWYPAALANKIAGYDIAAATYEDDGSGYGNVDIKTQFNARLGQPNCLAAAPFYLGLDGNAGSKINFVETLLHELGHGLGFSVLTVTTSTGSRYAGWPSVWEGFMFGNVAQKSWLNMTNAERKASAISPLKLAWTGPNVAAGQGMLAGTPVVSIMTPAPGATGLYDFSPSAFGPTILTPSALGKMANVVDQGAGPGCDAFNVANTNAVRGKVAIILRGTCGFAIKVKNAQNAGATAVLLANNQPGTLTPGGTDPSITIPSALISQADGAKLIAAVNVAPQYGSRSVPGAVSGTWSVDNSRIAGADATGRPLLYTPATLAPGSSVSHWDVTATPNLLMEPNINSDLGTVLTAPKDLTLPLLKDLGW